MAQHIRGDLIGVVLIPRTAADPLLLKAGDPVPDGVEVGDHVLEPDDDTDGEPARPTAPPITEDRSAPPADPPVTAVVATSSTPDPAAPPVAPAEQKPALTPPPKYGSGSGTDAWRTYATQAARDRGLNIHIPGDAGRADIIEALVAAGIPTDPTE